MKTTLTTKALVFLVLSLIFQSCVYQMYEISSKASYAKRIAAGKPKKFVILDQSYFKNKVDVAAIINMLNQNTFATQGQRLILETEERRFLTAINQLMKGEYAISLSALNSLPDSAFDCQVQILKADCIHKMNASVSVLAHYQNSFDCTRESTVKEIAKNRYRFTLYGF
jgi:hypothetical protein